VGFTTDPMEGRSTRYSSDLAKGFDVPIVHVNADDPEAAISAIRLAMAYRREFGHDVVVDLVGYSRFGHNEQDEAAYTQPLMVEQIANHPTVRELYQAQLVAEGVLTDADAEAVIDQVTAELGKAHDRLRESFTHAPTEPEERALPTSNAQIVTAVDAHKLEALNAQLLRRPEGFTVHPKLVRQLERRATAMVEGGIDWGHAES